MKRRSIFAASLFANQPAANPSASRSSPCHGHVQGLGFNVDAKHRLRRADPNGSNPWQALSDQQKLDRLRAVMRRAVARGVTQILA